MLAAIEQVLPNLRQHQAPASCIQQSILEVNAVQRWALQLVLESNELALALYKNVKNFC